jgi:hypothetical protein
LLLVAAGPHWPEDTLAMPPKKLAFCVSTERSEKRFLA